MKLATANKYAREVARRLHSVNGLLATPLCNSEAARISRVWVFGSTVKGSQNPNDLDLLIEIRPVGRRFKAKQARPDRALLRRMGVRLAPSSVEYGLKWLTKGMKMVSRHRTDVETAELDVKVLIYPRWEMTQ
jgi:predicted nucleotidyltransferase